ncbi:hypothetical protein M3A88_13115 [Kocuria marina]|uniref:hypothetical protein n=1 Tax=Kocuria marina TaxID=223184 RepID=UPI002989F3CD|nr:hypothetical protein [Kocuria marina]MCT1736160.1 hypothetical protein [Kocuria marina]
MDTIAGMAISRVLNHGPRAAGAYLAHHPKTREPVVLKLYDGSATKDTWVSRVQPIRKLQTARSAPGIAFPRGIPTDPSRGQLVAWEYIDGPLLTEVLPTMTRAQGDAALLEITRTLATLHRNGIVHGGIHLGQFRMREGAPVLLDTGWLWRTDDTTPVPAEDVKALKSLAGAMNGHLTRAVWQCVRMSSLDLSETVTDLETAIRDEQITDNDPDVAALFATPAVQAPAVQAPTVPAADEPSGGSTTTTKQTPEADAAPEVAPEPEPEPEPEADAAPEVAPEPEPEPEPEADAAPEPEPEADAAPERDPSRGEGPRPLTLDEIMRRPTAAGEAPAQAGQRQVPTEEDGAKEQTQEEEPAPSRPAFARGRDKAGQPTSRATKLSLAAKLRPPLGNGATAISAPGALRHGLTTTSGRVIGGLAAVLVGLGLWAGIATLTGGEEEVAPQQTVSAVTTQAETTPRGYMRQSEWTVPIPDKGKVFASDHAAVTMTSSKLTLYSPADGKKIRDVKLSAPVDYISETRIGDQDAIVWRAGGTLHAWTEKAGAKGKLVEAKMPSKSSVSTTGDQTLVVSDGGPSVLTAAGLQKLNRDGDLTPMAVDDEGLISGGFDAPVHISKNGSTKSVNLAPPKEGQRIHSWINAGHGFTATLWAKDPETQDPDQEVTMAVHNLATGEITTQATGPFKDLKPRNASSEEQDGQRWITGQGARTAAYGTRVISLRDGKQITEIPGEYKVSKVKGGMVAAKRDDQSYIFQGADEGYPMRSSLIAQTPTTVILQEGSNLVGYGSSKA